MEEGLPATAAGGWLLADSPGVLSPCLVQGHRGLGQAKSRAGSPQESRETWECSAGGSAGGLAVLYWVHSRDVYARRLLMGTR